MTHDVRMLYVSPFPLNPKTAATGYCERAVSAIEDLLTGSSRRIKPQTAQESRSLLDTVGSW